MLSNPSPDTRYPNLRGANTSKLELNSSSMMETGLSQLLAGLGGGIEPKNGHIHMVEHEIVENLGTLA